MSARDLLRLFTAILLPPDVRANFADACSTWRGRNASEYEANWVRADNLHVTLKFLGEVPDAHVASLVEALAAIPQVGPIRLQPHRIECLPARGPVRVVAVGLTGGLTKLVQLVSSIEARLAPLGFPPEGRPFLPHVTVARARPPLPRYERDALTQPRNEPQPTAFTVHEWALVQSHLRPDGPVYTPLAAFPIS